MNEHQGSLLHCRGQLMVFLDYSEPRGLGRGPTASWHGPGPPAGPPHTDRPLRLLPACPQVGCIHQAAFRREMKSYTVSEEALLKVLLHAAKYPTSAVNGVLLGSGGGAGACMGGMSGWD